jgi:predicted nucleic acid-binding protein
VSVFLDTNILIRHLTGEPKEVYENEPLDFADAYLIAQVERSEGRTLASSTREIDRVGP